MEEHGKCGLTDEQLAVVEAITAGKMVLAKAGAGSGKTKTLVEAYARLVEKAKDAANPFDRILAITFTNEAAYKLKKAVFDRTDSDVRALLTDNISTIHSFCNSVLSAHLVELSIKPSYVIADEGSVTEAAFGIIDRIASAAYGADEELRRLIAAYGYDAIGRSGFRQALYGIYSAMRMQGIRERELESLLAIGSGKLLEFTSSESVLQKDVPIDNATRDFVGRAAGTFGRYLIRFWREFENYKKLEGMLTFDDVLYYTYQLLSDHDYIRDFYRKEFDYILVDEFQDTDRLQYEIITMISDGNRLAFVGDQKQSIYEWRNADPAIINSVEREITSSGRGISLEMSDNFRSTPQLISFFNLVFARVFEKGSISYTAMRHANSSMTDLDEPAVRIMLPGGANIGERREREASLICEEARRLVSSDIHVEGEENGQLRPLALRDMAILFRSRTPVEIYARALRENGIPFIHVQSESFFEKREVIDIMNYLNHLADPADRFYTFASLRSPLFGLSDETLISLSANRFDVVKTAGEANGRGREKLLLFASIDEECSRNRNAFAHRMLSVAIEKTRIDLVYLSARGGKQAYANILKLLDMIRSMEKDGPVGLLEAVRSLNRMAEEGTGESEYPLNDERSDAIRLMTVHASKGLEFPVVFVADSSRENRNGKSDSFYHPELGVVPGVPRKGRETTRDGVRAVNSAASIRRNESAQQEDRRIFYVSLTRARQLLYLSQFESRKKNDPSWNGTINSIIPLNPGGRVLQLTPDCSVLFIRPGSQKQARGAMTGRVRIKPVVNTLPARLVRQEGIRTIATELADFMVCPLRKKLGKAAPSASGIRDRIIAAERGNAVHSLLEDYNYVTGVFPFSPALADTAGDEIRKLASGFIKSVYGEIVHSAILSGKLRREFPFTMKRGAHTISGKIDLVAEEGGNVCIVDYKTGDISRHTPEYTNQLMLYAIMLRELGGKNRFRLVNFAVDNPSLTRDFSVGKEELDSFGMRLDAALADMVKGVEGASPSPENCGGCDFKSTCEFADPPERKRAGNMVSL